VLRIILRSGIITARNLPAAAGPCVCVRSFVTSDGMGGTVPSGDESGRVVSVSGYGRGTAGWGMVSSFRKREGQGAASPSATAGLAISRNAATEDSGAARARMLTGAQQGGRQLPPAAAYHPGPVAGT
jgi:hypothetical protein